MVNLTTALTMIDDQYIEMVRSIERLMEISIEVLKSDSFDMQLLGESMSLEDRINRLDLEIREDSIIALARFQPAATDLRKLIMMTDSARLLERMGDLLKANIVLSKDILENYTYMIPAFQKEILPMASKIKNLLSMYIKAYIDQDENLLYAIVALDEEIDQITQRNYEVYIEYMDSDKKNIRPCTDLLLIDKKYERISDHIVHLSKDLMYILNGKNLRKIELLSQEFDEDKIKKHS